VIRRITLPSRLTKLYRRICRFIATLTWDSASARRIKAAWFVIDGKDARARNCSENIDLDQYGLRAQCTDVVPTWRKFQCADWL
jgi:hypothetical protein